MKIAPDDRAPAALLAGVCAVFVWSLAGCHDRFTWFLETVPAMIAIPALILLYPRFRFTDLVYALIAVHASILMVGGHYSYERMPVFNWIRGIGATCSLLFLTRLHDRVLAKREAAVGKAA